MSLSRQRGNEGGLMRRAHHKHYLGDEHEELDHLRLRNVVLDGVNANAQSSKEVVPVPATPRGIDRQIRV